MPRLGEVSSWSARRLWWSLAAAFFVAIAAWSLGTPLMTGHDEAANAVRAAAVVRGELLGEPVPIFLNGVVEVSVPEAFGRAAEAGSCFLGIPEEVFAEAPPPGRAECVSIGGGGQSVLAETNQYRNQPVFPALVGAPTLLLPNEAGAYLMRLTGAAACAALLASAAASICRLASGRVAAVALACAVTPEVLYVAGTTNTAGPEMAASATAFATGLALATGDGRDHDRLIARFGVALIALAVSRPLSPLFVVAAVASCAVVAGWTKACRLWQEPRLRGYLVAAVVASAASGLWVLYVRRHFPLPPFEGRGVVDSLERIGWWMRGTVGVFGSTDVVPPAPLHLGWGTVTLVVVVLAVRRARRRGQVVVVGLTVLALGLLLAGEGLAIPDTGFWWQGRYVMPLLIGEVVTAGALGSPTALGHKASMAIIGALVALHLWAFLYAARHYAVGYGGTARPWRFLTDPVWTPPTGPAALWAAALVSGLAAAHLLVLGSVDGVRSPAGLDSPAPAALGMAR